MNPLRPAVPLFVAGRERGAFGKNPLSLAALDSSPEGRALGRTGRFRPRRSTAGRRQPISGKLFASAKASPFRERWHGEAVTERVDSGTNPFRHFALRNATSPEGGGLGKKGRFRPHRSTAGRSQPISGKLFASAKASPFRERWHGEAVTERVAFGKNPFRHFALRNATSPEGGGLGKEGRSRPHQSTAGRSLPISGKLFASAKASPFRERWHGEAVTERVTSGAEPCRRGCPPPTAKKPACPLPFYGAGKLAFVFLFRGRAYSSILPKPRPSKSSTRSVRLGATGSALAASRGA